MDVDQAGSGYVASARRRTSALAVLAHSDHVCARRACARQISPSSFLACTVKLVCGGAQNWVGVLDSNVYQMGCSKICCDLFFDRLELILYPPLMLQPLVKRSYSRTRRISLGAANRNGCRFGIETQVANFMYRSYRLESGDFPARNTIDDTSSLVAANREPGILPTDSPTETMAHRWEFADLADFLLSLPSAAIQSCAADVDRTAVPAVRPFQLDRSAEMESTTETVRRVCPRRYRGGECG